MSKVLPADEVDECARWEIPAVEDSAAEALTGVGKTGGHLLTAKQLEELQTQAYEEAYVLGRQEGIAAGRDEIGARIQQLEALIKVLSEPLDELDECVEEQLVALAIAIARQLVRRELKIDPHQIIGVVRESLQILPVASRNVRLHLHPKDAELVRQALSEVEGERAWQIVEDPVMSRGGCRVNTDTSQIDARVESRLGAVISAVLGDERGGARADRREPEPGKSNADPDSTERNGASGDETGNET